MATDAVDGYTPQPLGPTDPAADPNVQEAIGHLARRQADAAVRDGRIRIDNLDGYRQQLEDGYKNLLTGIGDPSRDKIFGGRTTGPEYLVRLMTRTECEDRWRGNDLGKRIVEAIPNEMTRRGFQLQIQPSPEDAGGAAPTVADGLRHQIHALERRGDVAGARAVRVVLDALPAAAAEAELPAQAPAAPGAPAAPPHTPGMLPDTSDDGTETVEEIEATLRELGAMSAVREALCYERAYGGGAILLGVDDGEQDLTRPLDMSKVRGIRHLTAYTGGFDGEVTAWSYYADPREPRFGEPRIYMLRNLGVPIASPPAPGETQPPPTLPPAGPTGALIFYVHESRLLVFDGQPVSRRVRVQMRGWGDSVFTRVEEVLSQFGQTWSGVAALLQEFSIKVLKMDGLAQLLARDDPGSDGIVAKRAIAMQMAESICRMRLIDKNEELTRVETSTLAGVAEVLREIALRLAAAAGMPVSMLFGQVQGGLGDASKGDVRFFYDQIEGAQEERLLPQLRRLYRLLMLATKGPTQGREPHRWSLEPNPLWQESAKERADREKVIADTDSTRIKDGVASPEEVAATRYGGSTFNDGPIVLDVDGRAKMAALDKPRPTPALAPAPGGPAPVPTGQPRPPAPGAGGAPAPQPAPAT